MADSILRHDSASLTPNVDGTAVGATPACAMLHADGASPFHRLCPDPRFMHVCFGRGCGAYIYMTDVSRVMHRSIDAVVGSTLIPWSSTRRSGFSPQASMASGVTRG